MKINHDTEAEAFALSATRYASVTGDSDALALARLVASAEGITLAEALADQADLFGDD